MLDRVAAGTRPAPRLCSSSQAASSSTHDCCIRLFGALSDGVSSQSRWTSSGSPAHVFLNCWIAQARKIVGRRYRSQGLRASYPPARSVSMAAGSVATRTPPHGRTRLNSRKLRTVPIPASPSTRAHADPPRRTPCSHCSNVSRSVARPTIPLCGVVATCSRVWNHRFGACPPGGCLGRRPARS